MSPEAWVAERNIDRLAASGELDVDYLRSLGPDATPAIVTGLPGPLASCVLRDGTPTKPDDLLGWNLGRARAGQVAATVAAVQDPVTCASWLLTGYQR